MIVIEIVGMDRYMLYEYSKVVSKNIANLFEAKEDEVFFQAGETKLVHDGNDQTSWHALVRIHAPKKYEVFEKRVANYVLTSITDYILNAHVLFAYIDDSHLYHKINGDYPLFFVHDEEEYEESDEDEEEKTPEEEISEEDNELYEGNIFENFEEKHRELHECCCGDDDECQDEHECLCHHKHK